MNNKDKKKSNLQKIMSESLKKYDWSSIPKPKRPAIETMLENLHNAEEYKRKNKE